MKLDLKVKRTPVDIGGGETICLDLEDIAVLERAERVYKRLNAIMGEIKAPSENASEDEQMSFAADVIRKANAYAKSAIDEIFDEPIAEKAWGNSSCISFGDTTDNSRFGRAVKAILELYGPAITKMAKQIEKQSDAFVSEVLDEGDSQT